MTEFDPVILMAKRGIPGRIWSCHSRESGNPVTKFT